MVMIGSVTGLTNSDLCEAMQTIHKGEKKVYVDVGDGILRMVETIRAGEVDGEAVVVLRALL
jgi:hypothetical protein